jgi:hypothetical protein
MLGPGPTALQAASNPAKIAIQISLPIGFLSPVFPLYHILHRFFGD